MGPVRRFLLLLLSSASLVFASSRIPAQIQQQPAPDSQQTSQQSSSPQTSPSAGDIQHQPPAQQEQSKSEANSRIQRSAEDLLSGDPQLTSADVQVNVDDHTITLTGTVDSYAQHDRVLALMHQYSRYRRIVDKLQTK